jgi:hypothetical protein
LEAIYQKLLNDEWFINALDHFANFIDGIDYLVDRLGGLEGVLTSLGAVFTRVFSKQLSDSIKNTAYNLKMMLPGQREKIRNEKLEILEEF